MLSIHRHLQQGAPTIADISTPQATAGRLASRLASTAIERDQSGGHAATEREWIRESGLLSLSVPVEFGGQSASWPTVYETIRILAREDSALAHVFAFHHLQLATIQLYGSTQQQRDLLTRTVEQRLFWGNALNTLDQRTVATRTSSGWLIDGSKSFCSGSLGSDWLTVSAWDEASATSLVGVVPTRQPGITVNGDWDAFGQRQTDSGTVQFSRVHLDDALVLRAPAAPATPLTNLRTLVSQLIMSNLYLGIAEGAFDAARGYTASKTRAWVDSGVDSADADPLVQHRYGQLWLLLRPAQVLTDLAAREIQQAWVRGASLNDDERGRVAIAVSEAKCLAHKAAIDISNQMFELTGARSTSEKNGYDRYWRNARVHTLHDPVDYKLRDLGRFALTGDYPQPGSYS